MKKILCIATASLALLTGCYSIADGVHAVQPRDIPVPKGMKLKTHLHASNTLEIGEYRYADLVYEGGASSMQVADYLLKRMPQHSYRIVSQKKLQNEAEQLVFERGPYVSTCTIRSVDRLTRLEIRVRTHPKL